MASAGTVTVDFAAETARFTSELRKVNQSIDGVGSQFDKVGRIAKTAFAAFSVIAVTNQLQQLITKSLELGGAIQDATEKAGISARAFSELNVAAKLAGIGADDLSSAFAKFQRELAGGGEKIASLGINLEKFRALQPDRQFEVLAEAVASIEDPALRVGAAIEVFGKSGANLLPLFNEGAKGIRAARDEAKKLGASLGAEEVKNLDDAGKAIDKLTIAFDGLATKLTAKVATAITTVAEKLAGLAGGAEKSEVEIITARIAELDKEIEKRSRNRQVGRGGIIPAEDPNAAPLRVGRGGIPANLNAFIRDRAALSEALERAKIEQRRIDATAAAATAAVVDPNARTLGTNAEEIAKKTAKLNEELFAAFDRNQQELGKLTDEFLEQQLEAFERTEQRKTQIAAQEMARRTEAEEALAQFQEQKRQEEAQREFELSNIKLDIVQGGLALIAAVTAKDAKLQKRIAIAAATINTIQGVTNQLKSGDPYTAIPRAIAVGLFGAAQIAKIVSTPELGAGGGASIGGGSGPTIGTQPTSPFDPSQQRQQPQALQQPPVTQVIFNGLITPESKQAIVDVLREATDNDVIVIDQRSAQAQMFMAV